MSGEIKIELGELLERVAACWEKKQETIPAKRTSIVLSRFVYSEPMTPLWQVLLNAVRDAQIAGGTIEQTFHLGAVALPEEHRIQFYATYNAAPEIFKTILIEEFTEKICEEMIERFISWLGDQ